MKIIYRLIVKDYNIISLLLSLYDYIAYNNNNNNMETTDLRITQQINEIALPMYVALINTNRSDVQNTYLQH